MDESSNFNVIHFGSVKCKRVTRSALSSELYVMVLGFDHTHVIRKALGLFFDKEMPLKIYTDSRNFIWWSNDSQLHHYEATYNWSKYALRKLREEIDVFWILSDQNPADAVTKYGSFDALNKFLAANKVKTTPAGWIERSNPSWMKLIPKAIAKFANFYQAECRPSLRETCKHCRTRNSSPCKISHFLPSNLTQQQLPV